MPVVKNVRKSGKPSDAVQYVGRPSIFGNPFEIGRDGSRAEVIAKYRDYIEARPELQEKAVRLLAGMDLYCWCAPEPCHADILLAIANS